MNIRWPDHLPSSAQYGVYWESAEARLQAALEVIHQRAKEGQAMPRSVGIPCARVRLPQSLAAARQGLVYRRGRLEALEQEQEPPAERRRESRKEKPSIVSEISELRSWLLRLTEETMEYEGGKDAAHDYDHIMRVMALADTIQAREGGDLPTIWAAVALHDIGQARERRSGGDHAQIGAEMAANLLTGTRFPQTAIPVVQQAIRDHRMTGNGVPQSLEGRILYDADKIDSLGAVGIGRLYCITGHYNQKVYGPLPAEIVEPVDPLLVRQLRRRPDYSPSIEFHLLFGNLPERMTTETGRELARERYEYMAGFFTRLQLEVEGKL